MCLRPELLATYHYNQHIIALTHVVTLGFAASIIMGALYQLAPVVLEIRLHSERLVRWHFAAHVVGLAGMVSSFWIWDLKLAGLFGCVMGLGIGLFAYNLGRTIARAPEWNVVALAISSALFWLAATLLAGLYLAATKCWSFSPFAGISAMHAHAHLGGIGVFLMLIAGVSFKLVPMFSLSEIQNARRAVGAILLLNAALLGLFVTMLLSNPWKLAFSILIVAALALYGWELIAILRARKRQRLDWGLKYFITAVGLLGPVSLLGVFLSWPNLVVNERIGQLENVYGLLALLGVVTLAILGMLYKIVPFLVWQTRYSREIGRNKVPTLADLYSAPLQALGYWIYVAGLLAVCVTTILGREQGIRWSGALLCAALAIFAINMAKILSHLVVVRTRFTASLNSPAMLEDHESPQH